MSTIDPKLLKIFSTKRSELHKRFKVASLSVFGSVSRGEATTSSDIDILVRFHETPGIFGFLELKQYLEEITGRSVDLVTEKALKRQLKDRILKETIRVA